LFGKLAGHVCSKSLRHSAGAPARGGQARPTPLFFQHSSVAVKALGGLPSSRWNSCSERILTHRIGILRGDSMQKFFFDMKDGVPHRDTVGIEFKTNAEAIGHCREIAQHFRDESLRDDQDLEISVVNALGREIHREFVHRE
jgi:hypothetical protein